VDNLLVEYCMDLDAETVVDELTCVFGFEVSVEKVEERFTALRKGREGMRDSEVSVVALRDAHDKLGGDWVGLRRTLGLSAYGAWRKLHHRVSVAERGEVKEAVRSCGRRWVQVACRVGRPKEAVRTLYKRLLEAGARGAREGAEAREAELV
jgi:hypothetical protein